MTGSDSAVIPQDEVLTPARPVTDRGGHRFVILLANAKGGCGKTTLSTSLASYYAGRGRDVTLLDLDPQQSATQWCRQRKEGGNDDIRLVSIPLDGRFHAGKLQGALREAGDLLIIDSPPGSTAWHWMPCSTSPRWCWCRCCRARSTSVPPPASCNR